MRKSVFPAGLLVVAAAAVFGQDQVPDQNQDRGQDPPSRVARLNYMSGSVSFRPGSVEEWTEATLNYPLYDGDHLWADRGSRTELHVGSTALRMGSETALAVLNLDDRMVQLSLTGGTLHVRLRSLAEGESFEVDTPNAAITLLRSGEYLFFVDSDTNLTTVTVRGGDAEVIGGGRALVLHARESARLSGTEDNFVSQVERAPLGDQFEFWCQERDRREEQSESVRHVSREMIGYEDLDANGSWSEVPDYGWVWAPRVHAGWAPYSDGRWAWVEPWGWTWIDEAPWGFAPFHYGRWANHHGGWVWIPGARVVRPVYAPALVAFVGGPHGGVSLTIGGTSGVAWFPLGPHEVYRPAYRSSAYYVRQVNVTHVSVTNINVTNVRYVNQNQASVTVVSRDVFVGARPVRNAHMMVGGDVIAQGRVFGSTANIAPERSSVMVRTRVTNVQPPSRYDNRAVVVRHAPPPPPVSFAARREALQANPGRPLDRGSSDALRRSERPTAPAYRQVSPAMQGTRPVTPQSQYPGTRPETRDVPRDRSRPVEPTQPDQPRREPRQEQVAPRSVDRQPDQPRREPRQEQQVPRPQQHQNADQPRNQRQPERSDRQHEKPEKKQEEKKQ